MCSTNTKLSHSPCGSDFFHFNIFDLLGARFRLDVLHNFVMISKFNKQEIVQLHCTATRYSDAPTPIRLAL